MMPSTPAPPVNAIAPVATPFLTLELGYVAVRGMWQNWPAAAAARWSTRRTARTRWGGQRRADRQEWKTQEP